MNNTETSSKIIEKIERGLEDIKHGRIKEWKSENPKLILQKSNQT